MNNIDQRQLLKNIETYLENGNQDGDLVNNFFREPYDLQVDAEQAWKNIEPSIQASTRKLIPMVYRIAASVAILLMVGISFIWLQSDRTTTFFTENNTRVVNLADGSIITLNENSSVTVGDLTGKQRNLTLTGEAYLEVEPGNPFQVMTPTGTITVLGTSFNVNAQDNETVVYVNSGKVKLEHNNQSILLATGDLGTSNTRTVIKSSGSSNILAWKSGELVFEKQPLSTVLKELSNYYNIQLTSNDKLGKCLITIKFDNLTIDECLLQLGKILDFETSHTKNQIVLSGRGC